MPYTAPNTFVTATPIDAEEIVENNEELRKYLNTDIIQADIDDGTVDTTDIVRGEYFQVTKDHQFTSGDIYSQYRGSQTKDRAYTTGQLKNLDDLGDTYQWLVVPNTGKRFFLEADAMVFYHVYCEVHTGQDQLSDNDIEEYTQYALNINGSAMSDTWGYSFEEKSGALIGAIDDGCSTTACHARPFCGIQMVALTAGWNEISVVANCNSSHSYMGAASTYIEIFYNS